MLDYIIIDSNTMREIDLSIINQHYFLKYQIKTKPRAIKQSIPFEVDLNDDFENK